MPQFRSRLTKMNWQNRSDAASAVIKRLREIASVSIILASIGLCHQIISNSLSNQNAKIDDAELNHVQYGLFSIEEWKRQINPILAEEINKLYLSRANEQVLRRHLAVLLNTLINQIDQNIRGQNSGSIGGRVKQTIINMAVKLEDIKKGIPEYVDRIIEEMTKVETRRDIKAMLNQQLEHYSDSTYDAQDRSEISRILLRTDSKDIEAAKKKLGEEISVKNSLMGNEVVLLIVLSVILFCLSAFSKEPLAPLQYGLLVSALFMLLISGVSTPAIDMEAKITKMTFILLGHSIHFENQVLYFQSKSILDVFWIMMTHRDIQMKIVGLLLLTFSVLFPLLKLASSLGYYVDFHHSRNNPVIRFFVLKSGKWSMADVMVVAVFMAYIGFNGIIGSQLGQLGESGQEQMIVTTNGTSLQPGFYLFLAYTMLALLFSEFLDRKRQDTKAGK